MLNSEVHYSNHTPPSVTSSAVFDAHKKLYAADLNINDVPLGVRVADDNHAAADDNRVVIKVCHLTCQTS